MVVSNRNLLVQGSILRGYVSFREGIQPLISESPLGCPDSYYLLTKLSEPGEHPLSGISRERFQEEQCILRRA